MRRSGPKFSYCANLRRTLSDHATIYIQSGQLLRVFSHTDWRLQKFLLAKIRHRSIARLQQLHTGPYAGFLFGGADEPSGGQWRRRRRRASAAGARIEALAPKEVGAGGGVPLPRQLGGLGERCKLPQWGPGRSAGRF